MENKKWWVEDQPLTISAIQCKVEEGSERILNEYVSKFSFNTEQLYHLVASSYFNYYSDEKFGAKLDWYLKKSRKAGLREIVYTNTHCMDHEMGNAHPEYWSINKNGDPIFGYGVFHIICVNPEGAFHKRVCEDIAALCRHDIDGIFFDGPLMREDGCYCEVCQRTFMERFGHSIFDSTASERRKMRVDCVTEHIKELYGIVKAINPNIAVYLNNSALRSDITGSNTRKLYNYVDILGAEGGFHSPSTSASMIWQTSAYMKHLEAIIGDPRSAEKPMVNFFAANESGIRNYMHTPAETLITYAHTLASGANVWYGPHYNIFEAMQTEGIKVAKQMNEFILANKDLFKPSKTCARIALMWSEDTANNYSSSVEESDFTGAWRPPHAERGDHRNALFSILDILERNHIQFDIVDEMSILENKLDSYSALILPGVACMSEEVAGKIKDFVYGGGNLLGNFDVATYDKSGLCLGTSRLSDVFGFKGEPRVFKTSHAFMFAEKKDAPLLSTLTSAQLPAPKLDAEWEFEDSVCVLMSTSYSMPSPYETMPDGRYPSLTEHSYGKGKAFYVSGNFAESRLDRNVRDYCRIVKRFCEISAESVVISENAGLYEVVLRRQNDRYLLHIVNMTGSMERPLENLVPLANVKFELDLSGFDVNKESYSLKTARGGDLKNISQNGQKISFTLSELRDYEIIVIE